MTFSFASYNVVALKVLTTGTKMCTLTVLPNLLDPGKHVEYLFHAVSNIKPLKVVSQHNTLFFYCVSGKPKVGEVIKNVQCGYDVRRKDYVSPLTTLLGYTILSVQFFKWGMQPGDLTQVIYDRGCLRSGEDWVRRNLVPVAAVAVALAVLQVYTENKRKCTAILL